VFTRGGFVTSTDKASTTGIERMGSVRTRESRTGVRSAVITLRGAQPNTVFTISYYTSDGGCILGDGGFGTITTDARGTARKTVLEPWRVGHLRVPHLPRLGDRRLRHGERRPRLLTGPTEHLTRPQRVSAPPPSPSPTGISQATD
jgi:hypothetical protein